jgi:crotonobetainyl-CoA:carnitine CoA-transferase CaiB-like acyl-CoA transferase
MPGKPHRTAKSDDGLPLSDIKILDLTRLVPGAYCTLILADLGAEVVKVEEPQRGDYLREFAPFIDEEGGLFSLLNRNKKSITLNLKHELSIEALLRLCAEADVMLEGFRPDVKERLGFDYETVSEINSDLVYCSISGYGQTGPYRDRPSHDLNIMGLSSALSVASSTDGVPSVPPFPAGDFGGGGQLAAISILSALIRRERTGRGDYIDVSLLDGTLPFMGFHLAHYLATGETPSSEENLLSGKWPFYAVYQTADGKFITVAALEDRFWRDLCEALGRPDLKDKQHVTGEHRIRLREELQLIFKGRSRDEWLDILSEADVCAGPVYDTREALSDPHIRQRGVVSESDQEGHEAAPHLTFPARFLSMSPSEITPPPLLGEHTEEILREIGYSESQIQRMTSMNTV